MNDKVLIRKQTSGGVQQFQTIGGQAPSFMDLARRVRDPNVGMPQRIGAGLGLAGKVGAGLGTIFQTAHQLQGGNALAPLGMGYTYQGLDPTAGMRNAVSEEQQIADKVRQMQINQQAKEQFEAMQQPQEEAVSSTSTTDYPNQSPTMQQLSELDPMREQPQTQQPQGNVVEQAAGALQGMPLQGGQASVTGNDEVGQIAQVMAEMPNMGMQPTRPAQPQSMPVPTGYNTSQATLQENYTSQQSQNPGLQPHQVPPNNPNFRPQPYMSPQGNPYPLGTEESRQWAAQQAWGDRPNFTLSFATQVLDEFGDMLHKADPHVAGLLAFRVYMDKMMR